MNSDLHFQQIPGTNLFKPVATYEAFQMLNAPRAADRRQVPTQNAAAAAASSPARSQQAAAFDRERAAFKAKLDKFAARFGVECGSRYAAQGLSDDQAAAQHAEFVKGVQLFGEAMDRKDAAAADSNRQAQLRKAALGSGAAAFAASLKLPA
jgi:hypothetical protein